MTLATIRSRFEALMPMVPPRMATCFKSILNVCICAGLLSLVAGVQPTLAQGTQPNWIQETPQTTPPTRNNSVLTYDSAHGQVVLFGGSGVSGFLCDTWVWDGTNRT
jgi:Galactose oxidase, central domain